MKKILIPCLALSVLAGCGGGNTGNNANTGDSTATETPAAQQEPDKNLPPLKMSDQEFFGGKTPLSKTVDLTEPVESMSYQRLRFIKAYVYASHGFWLKDFDLNTFFNTRTDWYNNLCYDRLEKDFTEKYWEEWNDNYDAVMRR